MVNYFSENFFLDIRQDFEQAYDNCAEIDIFTLNMKKSKMEKLFCQTHSTWLEIIFTNFPHKELFYKLSCNCE